MGERIGLHCRKHDTWCPSGTCDDCAAMAAEAKPHQHLPLSIVSVVRELPTDASMTIADNVGPGASMCEQGPETICDLVNKKAPLFEGLVVKLCASTLRKPIKISSEYLIGVDPGRDEGTTVRGPLTAEEIRRNKGEWQAGIDLGSVPDKTVMSLPWAAWRGLLYDSIRQWKPNLVEVLNSIPASVQALRRTDDLVGHFCNRLVAGGRPWSAVAAAELVVEMAARDAERVKMLTRLFDQVYAATLMVLIPK